MNLSTSRALLVGYFSTVGDLESLDVVRGWLDEAGINCDVAPTIPSVAAAMPDVVALDSVDPSQYSHLIVVCGPYYRDFYRRRRFDLDRFGHCVRIGVNLTILEPEAAEAFDFLIARDQTDGNSRPDIAFAYETRKLPVVGVCLAPAQSEYGSRQNHKSVSEVIASALGGMDVAVLPLDTHWPDGVHRVPSRAPAAFEAFCSRVDVIVTTRLHGLVLGLKSGTSVIAIDAIAGGGKVTQQAKSLDWSVCLRGEDLTESRLREVLTRSLAGEYDGHIGESVEIGRRASGTARDYFTQGLSAAPAGRSFATAPISSWSLLRIRFRAALKRLRSALEVLTS